MKSDRKRSPTLAAAVFRSLIVFGLIGAVAAATAGGWIGSTRVDATYLQPGVDTPPPQARVAASTERTLALESVSRQARYVTRDGLWAVDNQSNFGILAEVQDRSIGGALRRVELLGGSTFEVGSLVAVHPWAYGPDPTIGLNLAYDEVSLDTDLGQLGGWLVEAGTNTWAIILRDAKDERRASLRLVSELNALGVSTLVLDYRNQARAPADPSGRYQFGNTEWRDVEAGVDYLESLGANKVLLFGSGMGGAVVLGFLMRSDAADLVSGAVLEGPHLDARATFAEDLANSKLPVLGVSTPDILQDAALRLTGWRFGIDWSAVDYLSQADRLATPVLILHGDIDVEAPLAVSQGMATAAPRMVRLEVFAGAGHGEAWNTDRGRYRMLVADFVAEHAR